MTIQEFSDGFTLMLNNYSTQAEFGNASSSREITLDEYEKSFYLTKAQEEFVIEYYNGNNTFRESFESSEEVRRYLNNLVKTKVFTDKDALEEDLGIDKDSKFFPLPEDLIFITMEQIIYTDDVLNCYKDNPPRVHVQPVRQDEYNKLKGNPFRGITKYKAIRLDAGDNKVEIISKYPIKNYIIRYISKPSPIILEELPGDLTIEGERTPSEGSLPSILHKLILERAVITALKVKGININNTK